MCYRWGEPNLCSVTLHEDACNEGGLHMSFTDEATRQRAINEALALLRHQDLKPTPAVEAAAERFVRGEITLDELIAIAKTES